jgi:hypothetical protein
MEKIRNLIERTKAVINWIRYDCKCDRCDEFIHFEDWHQHGICYKCIAKEDVDMYWRDVLADIY